MTPAKIEEFCLMSSREINNLGANPVSGGSPPRERRTSIDDETREGDLGQEFDSWVILVELRDMREVNIADVMTI